MEVYTPIPDELLHTAPRGFRRLGTVVKVVALVGAAALLLRFAFEPGPPMFHNFGVVTTPIGTAVVACGGEVTQSCGETTALVFDSCDRVPDYFPNANVDPETTDAAVRTLIGKRPPAGSQWAVYCGHNGLHHDHAAELQPV